MPSSRVLFMHMRKSLAGMVVLAGYAALTVPSAQAQPPVAPPPQGFTCTAQDWAGHSLQPVAVQVAGDSYAAAREAQTRWWGKAKFATIACTPS